MPLQLKKVTRFPTALPKIVCSNCGHEQTIFINTTRTCTECFRYFYKNASDMATNVTARFDFYRKAGVNT